MEGNEIFAKLRSLHYTKLKTNTVTRHKYSCSNRTVRAPWLGTSTLQGLYQTWNPNMREAQERGFKQVSLTLIPIEDRELEKGADKI